MMAAVEQSGSGQGGLASGWRRVEGLLFGSQSPEGGQQPPKRSKIDEGAKTKDPT